MRPTSASGDRDATRPPVRDQAEHRPPDATNSVDSGEAELSRGLPAWALRLVLLVAGLGVVAVLRAEGLGLIFVGVVLVVAVLGAAGPASPAAGLLIMLAAIVVAAFGGEPLRPTVLVLVPLLHLLHVLSGLAGTVPWQARVHADALWPAAVRYLAVQVVAFALVGVAFLVERPAASPLLEVVGLLGLAGLAVLVITITVSENTLFRRSQRAPAVRRWGRVGATMGAWHARRRNPPGS